MPDVVGIPGGVAGLFLYLDRVEDSDSRECVVPREQRPLDRIAILGRHVAGDVIDDRVGRIGRASRRLRLEIPARNVVEVPRLVAIAAEIEQRLFEVADARIRDARNVAVVRRGDEVVAHLHLEAPRVGRVVAERRRAVGPRLAHAQHVVLRQGLGLGKERALRVEDVAAHRIERAPEVGLVVGHVAEKRRGGNRDGAGCRILGYDRRDGNDRTRERLLSRVGLGRVGRRRRDRVGPAQHDAIVDAVEVNDAGGRDVRFACGRSQTTQTGCRHGRRDEIAAELALRQNQVDVSILARDRNQTRLDLCRCLERRQRHRRRRRRLRAGGARQREHKGAGDCRRVKNVRTHRFS